MARPFLLLSLLLVSALCATVSGEDSAGPAPQPHAEHWAFQPRQISKPSPGGIQPGSNPIDAFIRAAWQREGITPAAPSNPRTWLRRVHLDLTGIPPTPEETVQFLRDPSQMGRLKTIDRLLASPRYGERWARHWLDLARYAESEGFKADETRPNAWRYRDYVIKSLNDDKPYNRFVQEQLAGDELWPESVEARIATGFNRHFPDESNARNLMQRRQEILNDITDTTASVFLGLTLGCARCHDHKTDPISHLDYYRFQAFFANVAASDNLPLLPENQLSEYRTRLAVWEKSTASIREEMQALEEPARKEILNDYIGKYPENIQEALRKAATERTPFEAQMVAKARLYVEPTSHQYLAGTNQVVPRLAAHKKQRWQELHQSLQGFASMHPGSLPLGTGLYDLGAHAPPTHLLRRGVWNVPKEEVAPEVPSVLASIALPPLPAGSRVDSSGRRARLALWLTRPDHPLTARVWVNRVWQHHFGRGLVESPSDFGVQGSRPSHAELLDWLAEEFVRHDWSTKHLHRLIVSSLTFSLSSEDPAEAMEKDPSNRWLARFPRRRLEGEVIRDSILATSGLLRSQTGGPSVFPPLPEGLDPRGAWPVSRLDSEIYRRSIYIFVRRNLRYPLFETLDMPDTHESCARRNVTTTPLQALMLFNSTQALTWAQAMAGRILEIAGGDPTALARTAFELAFNRLPTPGEVSKVTSFLSNQEALLAARGVNPNHFATPTRGGSLVSPERGAAVVDLCQVMLNSHEFLFIH